MLNQPEKRFRNLVRKQIEVGFEFWRENDNQR